MKKLRNSLILITLIAFCTIMWDLGSRDTGTSLLFKSHNFPYGIQPRLYGQKLQLFTTSENCIIIGNCKGLKPKSGSKNAYIEDIIRYAHNTQDLVIEYIDSAYTLHYMQLQYDNGEYYFSYLENGADYFCLKPGYYVDEFGWDWIISVDLKLFIAPLAIFFLLLWPFFFLTKCRTYLLFIPIIFCSLTFIVSDFLIDKYSTTFDSLCFNRNYYHSIFCATNFEDPKDYWIEFPDSNDPTFWYTMTSSISKDKSFVINQYYKNGRINIKKRKYDYIKREIDYGSEEIIDQKTAIQLLKNTKTFWGDIYERCEFLLAFIRLLSIGLGLCFLFLFVKSIITKKLTICYPKH